MSDVWQILVHSPSGLLRKVLTPADPVDSIWWTRRGDGSDVEGVIRGRGLDLRPRDIVRIDVANFISGTWSDPSPRFWGWVTESADPRNPGLTETRLVGGSNRLGEIPVSMPWLGDANSATDVAVLAAAAVSLGPDVPRLLVPTGPPTFPTLGFQLRQYVAASVPIARALDDLAAAVPGFTVLPGSTYAYGGVTFHPGDEVPPVTWGTRPTADGAQIFFDRATGTLGLAAAPLGLTIDWQSWSSEALVDRVRLVLIEATMFDSLQIAAAGVLGPNGITPWPVVHEVARSGGQLFATRVERFQALDGMRTAAWTAAGTSTAITNLANAWDSSSSTYASNTGVIPTDFSLSRAATGHARGLEIHYSSFIPIKVRLEAMAIFGDTVVAESELPSTEGRQAIKTLLTPFGWDAGSDNTAQITVSGNGTTDQCRVYNVRALEPDPDVLDRIALGMIPEPPTMVATVSVPNRLVGPFPNVEITLPDDSVVVGEAMMFEYSVTRDRGMSTSVRVNHSWPAAEETARTLVERRIKRALGRTW